MTKQTEYIVTASRPECGCVVYASVYNPDSIEDCKMTAKEVAVYVREGYVINTYEVGEKTVVIEACDHVD